MENHDEVHQQHNGDQIKVFQVISSCGEAGQEKIANSRHHSLMEPSSCSTFPLLTHFMPSEADDEATTKCWMPKHYSNNNEDEKREIYRHETILMDRTKPIFLCLGHRQNS